MAPNSAYTSRYPRIGPRACWHGSPAASLTRRETSSNSHCSEMGGHGPSTAALSILSVEPDDKDSPMDADDLSRRSLLQAHRRRPWRSGPARRMAGDRAGLPGSARRVQPAGRGQAVVSHPGRSGRRRSRCRANHSDRRHARRTRGRASCTSSTARSRRFSRGSPATIARSSPSFRRRFADGIQAPASFACAAIRAADRLPQDGRSHAVLRHDAAADAPRHVLACRRTAAIATASAGS